jgi:hypothetical protein
MPLHEQVARLGAVAPAAPLRTRHIYQNTMYELVGLVIERISDSAGTASWPPAWGRSRHGRDLRRARALRSPTACGM